VGQLGDRLREAREARGLTLLQVEETTRIRRVFLQALEEERFGDLPGDVYARGFIRNYAQFLGLDVTTLLAAYHTALRSKPGSVSRVLDEPLLRRGTGSAWANILLGLTVVLAIAVGAWWAYSYFALGVPPWELLNLPTLPSLTMPQANGLAGPTATHGVSPAATPTLRATVQALVPTALPTSLPPTAALTGASPTAAPTGVTPSPTPTPFPTSLLSTATPATTGTPQASPTGTPQISPTVGASATATLTTAPTITPTPRLSGPIRVETEVLASTWVEVSADGKFLFSAILEPGQSPTWVAERVLTIIVGNAGGLRLTVNGVKAPPLGVSGQVLKVEYTPETLPRG
jgi:cytoskeleton protein RodZ